MNQLEYVEEIQRYKSVREISIQEKEYSFTNRVIIDGNDELELIVIRKKLKKCSKCGK